MTVCCAELSLYTQVCVCEITSFYDMWLCNKPLIVFTVWLQYSICCVYICYFYALAAAIQGYILLTSVTYYKYIGISVFG